MVKRVDFDPANNAITLISANPVNIQGIIGGYFEIKLPNQSF
jgi:hypothetical protein